MKKKLRRLRYPSGIPTPGNKSPDGHKRRKRRKQDGPAWKWLLWLSLLIRLAEEIPDSWFYCVSTFLASFGIIIDPEALKLIFQVSLIILKLLLCYFEIAR